MSAEEVMAEQRPRRMKRGAASPKSPGENGAGARARGTRLAIGLRAGSPPERERWTGVVRSWAGSWTKAADFGYCSSLSTLRVCIDLGARELPDLPPPVKTKIGS